jgi:hypothetical protein
MAVKLFSVAVRVPRISMGRAPPENLSDCVNRRQTLRLSGKHEGPGACRGLRLFARIGEFELYSYMS